MPRLITAATEFVVPRSIPKAYGILVRPFRWPEGVLLGLHRLSALRIHTIQLRFPRDNTPPTGTQCHLPLRVAWATAESNPLANQRAILRRTSEALNSSRNTKTGPRNEHPSSRDWVLDTTHPSKLIPRTREAPVKHDDNDSLCGCRHRRTRNNTKHELVSQWLSILLQSEIQKFVDQTKCARRHARHSTTAPQKRTLSLAYHRRQHTDLPLMAISEVEQKPLATPRGLTQRQAALRNQSLGPFPDAILHSIPALPSLLSSSPCEEKEHETEIRVEPPQD